MNHNPVSRQLDTILVQSCRLMALNGFHGTSMRDLASATRRSLAGLYHYFGNKEELLYLINVRGFSTLLKKARAIEKKPWTVEEQLYALIYHHIHYFTNHLDAMHVMMLGTQDLDSHRGQAIKKLKTEYADAVQRVVQRFLKGRKGTVHSKKEIARKTYLLFGMMNWIFGWYRPPKHGSAMDLTDEIFHMFVTGTAAKTIGLDSKKKKELSEAMRDGLQKYH